MWLKDDAHPLGADCQEVANPGEMCYESSKSSSDHFGMMVLKVELKSSKISQAQLPSCGVSCHRGIFRRHVCPVCRSWSDMFSTSMASQGILCLTRGHSSHHCRFGELSLASWEPQLVACGYHPQSNSQGKRANQT